MNERLLQFIWQFQYFNKDNLRCTDGRLLHIQHPGIPNTNQGPDFSAGSIMIDNIKWVGNIELHIKASDWYSHQHQHDKNYSNIILHVVWQNDVPLTGDSKRPVATLELEPLVPVMMLHYYERLMHAQGFVPCRKELPLLSAIGWLGWKERLVAERLQRKAAVVLDLFKESGNHWEEVFWWLLAGNFGVKVNAQLFEQVAKSIPLNILAKHKNQLIQIECLLFGQSGLLNGSFLEDYPNLLQREYTFLAAKYALTPVNKAPDFLRMRPANFPTVRLAQLAALVYTSSHLFSKILEVTSVTELYSLFNTTANDYWHYHYTFDEPTTYKPKNLGKAMMSNLIINTIVPVMFAYGLYHKKQEVKETAIGFLQALPAETNSILHEWKTLGVSNTTAFDSQALLELKHEYCDGRHCLRCAVGNRLLKQA
ncbi:DUF2851 family protein [Panacibacter sp. DH6]|uniref:DUF2851 family protein n=1 Tax=Panacibacter microcysteis TaxID=2793269 RepID=A0A931EBH5_9BACT|nr:DUF2851 family protein [Panacibacter microcysteis]MBG9377521.1 DUF2851 family protein [Panacibacter microcysteis]